MHLLVTETTLTAKNFLSGLCCTWAAERTEALLGLFTAYTFIAYTA